MKQLVSEAVTEALNSRPINVNCSLGLDRDTHYNEHQFINSLMKMSVRLESIKWGLIGTIIRTTGTVIIGLVLLGLVTWAKVELKG